MQLNDPVLLKEVTEAFYAYEAALMADDIPAMDRLFRDAPETVRYGVGEVLYGIEEIREFRKGRGGSPQRGLGRVEITVYGETFATTNAEFFRDGPPSSSEAVGQEKAKRGRQSQAWVKFPDGWKVVSAHVSIEGGDFMSDFNSLNRKAFIERFGLLFEHSPWIVAQAETMRPFKDLEALHAGFMKVVTYAGPEAQLALLRAHPKLADKAQVRAGLTKESASEQASVGLNALTEAEFARFHELNAAYEARFGFPFIIAVRLAGGKAGILEAMQTRLPNDAEAEFATALSEVGKIVWLRLKDLSA